MSPLAVSEVLDYRQVTSLMCRYSGYWWICLLLLLSVKSQLHGAEPAGTHSHDQMRLINISLFFSFFHTELSEKHDVHAILKMARSLVFQMQTLLNNAH